MIHQTRNHREAREHFRSGQPGPGMILRQLANGNIVVFDRVEEARGHPTAEIDWHYARAVTKGGV